MSFIEQLPDWQAAGTEPPSSKKTAGFVPGEKPPADYFNWLFTRISKVLAELRTKISDSNAAVDAKVGTLTNLSTTNKSNIVSAVNELFQNASNGKTVVASAITGKGVSASGGDTFQQLADKVASISTSAKLSNLIKNGSFEIGTAGINGWVQVGDASQLSVNSTFKFGTRSLLQGTSTTGALRQTIPATSGHVYYLSAWGLLTQPSGYNMFGAIIDGSNSYWLNGNINTLNTWQFASVVRTVSGSFIDVQAGVWGDGRSNNANFDGFLLINLTNTFGSGKEPTQAQMDKIVSDMGGWWDSTLATITNDATFVEADLIAGKVAYGGGQRKIGIMVNQPFQQIATSIATSGSGDLYYRFPAGAYVTTQLRDGAMVNEVYASDPDFIASNIPADKNIFGLQGSIPIRNGSNGNYGGSNWHTAYESAYVPGYASVFVRPVANDGSKQLYTGDCWIRLDSAGFKPEYVRSDVNMFGMQGTMSVRTNDTDWGGPTYTDGAGALVFGFAQGAYVNNSGFGAWASTTKHDTNYIASNIRSGKSIFGLAGTLRAWNGERAYAEGTNNLEGSTRQVVAKSGSSYVFENHYCLQVNLGFDPSLVILVIESPAYASNFVTIGTKMDIGSSYGAGGWEGIMMQVDGGGNVTPFHTQANGMRMNAGFLLPIQSGVGANTSCRWYAYG